MGLLHFRLLEDRILLDGAIAHDIATPPTPSIAHADTHVVVISDNLPDVSSLKSALNKDAHVVSYDYTKDSLDSLNQKIHNALGNTKADSIAFLTKGSDAQINILKGLNVNQETLQNPATTDFWRQIGGYLKDKGTINILGSHVASDNQGTSFINALSQNVNEMRTGDITVRASTDLTGSSNLGGDWLLEYSSDGHSENFDAWNFYFKGDRNSPSTDFMSNESSQTFHDTESKSFLPFSQLSTQGATGSLTTYLWNDTNHNGIQDSGEPGIANQTVTMTNGTDSYTAVDNGNGNYSFSNINSGTYTITWTYSDSYIPTVANAGNNGNDSVDSDSSNSASAGTGLVKTTLSNITVSADATITNIDLGLVSNTADITTYVWNDSNHNGIQDSGEAGITGLSVTATNGADNYTAVDSGGGNYTFNDVIPGSYTISWVYSDSYAPTVANVGNNGNDNVDSDSSNSASAGTGLVKTTLSNITVSAGENISNIDLGLVSTKVTITTTVWDDTLNPNGLQDGNEALITTEAVKLYDSNNQFIGNFTNLGNGTYQLTSSTLVAGNYYIQWSVPSGKTFTTPYVSGGMNADHNSDAVIISGGGAKSDLFKINPGDTFTNIDAGFIKSSGTVNTFVWLDNNRNGWQDANPTIFENGIPQVSVMLVNDSNPSLNIAGTTDSSGHLTFNNVTPGTYHLEYNNKLGSTIYDQSPLNIYGTNSDFDSDVYISSDTTNPNWVRTNSFSVTNGGIMNLYDAGFTQSAVTAYVWNDANHNGIQDSGESPISDAQIALFASTDTNFANPILPTSISNGVYTFQYVTSGTYQLGMLYESNNTLISNSIPSLTPNQGQPLLASNDNDISSSTSVSSSNNDRYFVSSSFNIPSNTTISDIGLGTIQGSIITQIWTEQGTPNGLYNPGTDTPISNLTASDIQLYSAPTPGPSYTAPTLIDSSQYIFVNIGNGLYFFQGPNIENTQLAVKTPGGYSSSGFNGTASGFNESYLNGYISAGYSYTSLFNSSTDTTANLGIAFANTSSVLSTVQIKSWNDTEYDGHFTSQANINGINFSYNDPLVSSLNASNFEVYITDSTGQLDYGTLNYNFLNNNNGTYSLSGINTAAQYISIRFKDSTNNLASVAGFGHFSPSANYNISAFNSDDVIPGFHLNPNEAALGGIAVGWTSASNRFNLISRIVGEHEGDNDAKIDNGDNALSAGYHTSIDTSWEAWVMASNLPNSSSNIGVGTQFRLFSDIFYKVSYVNYSNGGGSPDGTAIFNGILLDNSSQWTTLTVAWFFKNNDSGSLTSGDDHGLYPANTQNPQNTISQAPNADSDGGETAINQLSVSNFASGVHFDYAIFSHYKYYDQSNPSFSVPPPMVPGTIVKGLDQIFGLNADYNSASTPDIPIHDQAFININGTTNEFTIVEVDSRQIASRISRPPGYVTSLINRWSDNHSGALIDSYVENFLSRTTQIPYQPQWLYDSGNSLQSLLSLSDVFAPFSDISFTPHSNSVLHLFDEGSTFHLFDDNHSNSIKESFNEKTPVEHPPSQSEGNNLIFNFNIIDGQVYLTNDLGVTNFIPLDLFDHGKLNFIPYTESSIKEKNFEMYSPYEHSSLHLLNLLQVTQFLQHKDE